MKRVTVKRRLRRSWPLALLLLAACNPAPARAQADPALPVHGFIWSENAGWIDMEPEFGGVLVHHDHLSGFAWSERVGWIRFGADGGGPYANTSAVDWGVNRTSSGALSGFAWSENAGWIRFDPAFMPAMIDPVLGRFEGFAWSAGLGWIHLRGENPVYGAEVDLPRIPVPLLNGWGALALTVLIVWLTWRVLAHRSSMGLNAS